MIPLPASARPTDFLCETGVGIVVEVGDWIFDVGCLLVGSVMRAGLIVLLPVAKMGRMSAKKFQRGGVSPASESLRPVFL
jgi:hypothetical protein